MSIFNRLLGNNPPNLRRNRDSDGGDDNDFDGGFDDNDFDDDDNNGDSGDGGDGGD